MSRFNPGDKVVYISHDGDTYYIPKYGTIGTVVKPVGHYYLVQWPEASVSAPYKWHALDSDLERATKETEEKDMFKVGDRVQIKTMEELEKEFPGDSYDGVRVGSDSFVSNMSHLCGRFATIKSLSGDSVLLGEWSDKSGETDWNYTLGMLKKAEIPFKVGDRVEIKSWDEMVKEFGVDSDGDIRNPGFTFVRVMKPFCGKTATITAIAGEHVFLSDWSESLINTDWEFSVDMLKKPTPKSVPHAPATPAFKVGDIIRGTSKANGFYSITDINMTKAQVVNCWPAANLIEVKILSHKTKSHEVGERYTVHPEYFELVDALAIPSAEDYFELVFKPPFTYAVQRDAAGHVIAQGEAKCSSEDTFTKVEGAALATQRLLEKLGKPSAAEKPFFSRDNLKTGDWVYTAEDVYQVFESPAFGKVLAAKSGWLAVADFAQNLFDDDPTGDIEFNVCKVVRPTERHQLCYDYRADGECIFERK